MKTLNKQIAQWKDLHFARRDAISTRKKRWIILKVFLLVVAISGLLLLVFNLTSKNNKGVQKSAPHQLSVNVKNNESSNVNERSKETEMPASEEDQTIEIPLEKQQLIGMKTTKAFVKNLQKIIRTVGKVEYDEKSVVTITTKIDGWIEKLYVDSTGKYVAKGDSLMELYSPELLSTQQEFINVSRWNDKNKVSKDVEMNEMLAKDVKSLLNAARQRLRLWDISDEQIERIEKTGEPIRTLTIHSSVNGYVIQKQAIKGLKVSAGERLFDIADLSTVWILSDIYEQDIPLIAVGQTAKISMSYFPGKEFSSRIDYIYPTLSQDTRTAKVRFVVPNINGQLKPQMFTNIEIKINIGNKLVIPENAVVNTGTQQIVYIDKGDGIFQPQEIKTGINSEGLIEVIKGIKSGEKVVSSAIFLVDSEAKLKGITPLHKH